MHVVLLEHHVTAVTHVCYNITIYTVCASCADVALGSVLGISG